MTSRREAKASHSRQSGHERVLAAVKHAVAEGRYEEGMLPSYRQLARELNVTKGCVAWAMNKLEREGLILRKSGRGVLLRTQGPSVDPEKQLAIKCINIVADSFADLPSFVEADYLAGYTEALDYVDIRMRFVGRSGESDSPQNPWFSPTLPIEAQGVILVNACCSDLLERLHRRGVLIMAQQYARYDATGLPPHFAVYVNKSGGAFQAVNHLLGLGHHHIGFLGGVNRSVDTIPGLPESNTVFEGYRAALNCAGLGCHQELYVHHAATSKGGRDSFFAAKSFLQRPRRPTAILASSDDFAQSVLDAARELKLRVPEDLSVIGFDNQPGSTESSPPLTTVSVPRRELATSAVALLLEAAENPGISPRTRILDTHLIIRETTAPPRAMK